jgi:hypothetical protein
VFSALPDPLGPVAEDCEAFGLAGSQCPQVGNEEFEDRVAVLERTVIDRAEAGLQRARGTDELDDAELRLAPRRIETAMSRLPAPPASLGHSQAEASAVHCQHHLFASKRPRWRHLSSTNGFHPLCTVLDRLRSEVVYQPQGCL